ncbi:transposase [Gammaproteobacteria bacterium 42_54_T18]|nr:transposase [Gammaproteobacteria bacterium 42_54_T18]
MFLPNDVYQLGKKRLRVLWTFEHIVVWIDIDDKKALPENSTRQEFEHLVADEQLISITDPYITKILTPPGSGSKAEQIQIKAWTIIEPLVLSEPAVYRRRERGVMVSDVMANHSTTRQTIYRYLRQYWQFGNSRNALSTSYEKCGGKGKQRQSGDVKRGSPRTRNQGIGVNVDDEIRRIFRVAIETCYLKKEKYEFSYAYNQVLIAFGIDPFSPEIHKIAEAPTKRQFRYFYEKEYTKIDVTKCREGEIDYLKDFRPVLGSSTAEVDGPGSRYQIDATIGDIYLVSSVDRTKIIGRPVIYVVADVFSRLVVGLYVGLEGPSWVSGMEALSNTVCDKQQFCKSYDIEIESEQWPAIGLPEAVLADKGEMLGRHVEVLSKSFNVRIENTASYRADWKGIVERYFRTIQTKFKPYVEGYVSGKQIGKKRNGADYRLDATLTLYEFTQMIIRCILYYNNAHILSKYDPDQDVPGNLEHNPRTLWEWGIKYRSGKLRRPPEDLVRINLLPHAQASITEKGIHLFSCFYTNAEALQLGWFERNYTGVKKVTVAYDPNCANQIYIRPNDKYDQYWVAELAPRSREFRGFTIWEVWERKEIKAHTAASSKLKQTAGDLQLDYHLKNIAEAAKAEQPDTSGIPKSRRTVGIRQNRSDEKQRERKLAGSKPQTTRDPPKSAEVLPFTSKSHDTDYDVPDMLEDLFSEDDDE